MIYVKRDASGNIADLVFMPEEGLEEVGLFDPELKAFVENSQNKDLIKVILTKLDLGMVRVIEDMVDVMVEKELILFTDLPEPVQNKLLFKRAIRQSISCDSNFMEEEIIQF